MASPLEALARVPNASSPAPGIFTAGQPDAASLQAYGAAGGKVVIDIRDPMEPRPFDEPAAVRGTGMEYVNVVVRQGALDDATLDRFLTALRGAQERSQPVLIHCASANRVGGVLIPWFILDRGMTEEQAVEAAMRVGLRGADLLEWGLDYSRRRQGGA